MYYSRHFDFMWILCDIDHAKHLTWSLMTVLRSLVPVNSHWKKVSSSSGALSLSTVIDPWSIVSLDYLKLREILCNIFAGFFNKLSWDSVASVTWSLAICYSIALIPASFESIVFGLLLSVFLLELSIWNLLL